MIQIAIVVETGGETHHFLQAVNDLQLAVLQTTDNHVEAVGAQIYGGNAGRYLIWQGGNPVQSAERLGILIKFRQFVAEC